MEDFGEVYQEYRELVYRFLFRLCRNEHLAEDLTQETFYQAIKGYTRFKGTSSVPTWLCAIAKNQYYSRLRRPQPLPLEDTVASPAPDLAESLLAGDRQMAALRQLHQLPEPYREVFTMRTFCDLSHKQIGALFGKSDSWARVTYYRARQLLLEAMEKEDEPT